MDITKLQRKVSLKLLVSASLAILSAILFFGLWPKGYSYSNNVKWISDQAGIRFGQFGIAYTDPIQESIKEDDLDADEFSIEIALKSLNFDQGFSLILAFHDGKDSDQLIIGQWRSYYIIMNGDDYDHKRRTRRIGVKSASLSPQLQFVTITTGKEGTKVYVDGQIRDAKKDFWLKMPYGDNARLILGNSVYGKHSWEGEIYCLAYYGSTLSERAVSAHYQQWSKKRTFLSPSKDTPSIMYLFNDKGGQKAIDHSDGSHDLKIPEKFKILDQKILSTDWESLEFKLQSVQDIFKNLVGFIPLGFMITATFFRAGYYSQFKIILVAMLLCFAVSLTIEIIQAWIPSRSSDSLDLILNTIGGFSSALICCQVIGKRLHNS